MRKNTPHKDISNRDNLQKEISSSQNSNKKDRKLMSRLLIIALSLLNLICIYDYPNLIEIFRKYGIGKSHDLLDIITEFNSSIAKYFIKGFYIFPIENWTDNRNITKSNKSEKNVILCVFLLVFYDNFIRFLEEYLKDFEKINKEGIISELKQIHVMVFQKNNSYNFRRDDISIQNNQNMFPSDENHNDVYQNDQLHDDMIDDSNNNLFDDLYDFHDDYSQDYWQIFNYG